MLYKLYQNLIRGFRGEPDFSAQVDHNFVLEDMLLTYRTPFNFTTDPKSRVSKLSRLDTDYFNENAESARHEHFICLDFQLYSFLNPISYPLIPYSSPGRLFIVPRIVAVSDRIDVTNLEELSQHLSDEYYEYYNDPIDEPNSFRGDHRALMEKAEEFANKMWPINEENELSSEELKDRKEFLLDEFYRAFPPIKPHIVKVGDQKFLHYLEGSLTKKSELKRFYCLPIKKGFFISFMFHYLVDKSISGKKFENWMLDSNWFDYKILETIQLTKVMDSKAQEIAGKLPV